MLLLGDEMADYSELVQRLRQLNIKYGDESADAIEHLMKKNGFFNDYCEKQLTRIAELEHQLKFECDTYLWERKRMSRRIAFLEHWMEKLFKFCSSPEARRNELTMATEIPDSLVREGEDILRHLEERSDDDN
jgi:hypothetical protein